MEKVRPRFRLNSSKTNSRGESPILLRITIKNQRKEQSTGYKASAKDWSAAEQRICSHTEYASTFNAFAQITLAKILKAERDILISGEPLTPESIFTYLDGPQKDNMTLLQAFGRHNEQMLSLVGKDITKSTYNRYLVSLGKVKGFLRSGMGINDISLEKLTVRFISEFEVYLKTHDKIGQNTAAKHLKNLKKIIGFSITNQWLSQNPFSSYRCRTTATDRGYLTVPELKAIEEKEFSTERLSAVRDLFVFGCYTGLSYSDVQKLTSAHITKDELGQEWIRINRTKTGTESVIPVLPKAKEILTKYQGNLESLYNRKLLPVRSNQKMNEYLREIGTLCGLDKRITCHLARHTFATTITLSNGVSIETVGKMLGQTNIRTTQIYAKMTLGRIASEMNIVRNKLSMQNLQICK